MLKHVLVPLDGSELAERALENTRQIISPDSSITLLMVVDSPEYLIYNSYGTQSVTAPLGSSYAGIDYQALSQDIMKAAHTYLNQVSESLQGMGYKVQKKVEAGLPAELIIQTAEETGVEAIVMSTHGRSGLGRWILGSVTQKVLSAASCPVFVIPPTERVNKRA